MSEGVLIGRQTALAMEEMVRQWEAIGRRLDRGLRAPAAHQQSSAPIVQAIEVTSAVADSDGYPARIQLFDGTSWTDNYAECRAVKIGGGTLSAGFYPPGRLMRVADSGLHVYGVHPGGTELNGLTFTSDTGSTADADNGNGLVWWNNATQSSATVLYFDNQTADGISVTSLWSAINSTGMGFIFLQQSDDSTKWQKWQWTAVTDGTGYRKFTVSSVGYGGAIADGKTVYCTFAGSPDAGSSVRGLVNATTQTYGGIKTFKDGLVVGTGAVGSVAQFVDNGTTGYVRVSALVGMDFHDTSEPTAAVSYFGQIVSGTESKATISASTDNTGYSAFLRLEVKETGPAKRLVLYGAADGSGEQVVYAIEEEGVGERDGGTATTGGLEFLGGLYMGGTLGALASLGAAADIGALTDNTGGTANTTLQALTDPADTPADADALRDDLVANMIPEIRNNFADLAAQMNAFRTSLRNAGIMS